MRNIQKARKQGLDLGKLVEINLLKDVKFNMVASSYPCAYRSESSSREKGEKIAGYVLEIGTVPHHYIDITPSSAPSKLGLGGFRVYQPAIHSFELPSSSQ